MKMLRYIGEHMEKDVYEVQDNIYDDLLLTGNWEEIDNGNSKPIKSGRRTNN